MAAQPAPDALFDPPEAASTEVEELELALIVRTLFEEFERAVYGGTCPWRRSARILKLVLFGSAAAADDEAAGPRDRHILVVVSDGRLTDVTSYWSAAEDRLRRECCIMGRLHSRVWLTIRSLADVNRQLEHGRTFFVRIAEEGRRLYEADGYEFASPKPRGREARREEAQAQFRNWLSSAERRLATFAFEARCGRDEPPWRKDAAFTLHQAVERLYCCLLLTLDGAAPRTHRIDTLRALAENRDVRLAAAWPRGARFERRCFDILARSYVGGRYWSGFAVTNEELAWLSARVLHLRDLVHAICREELLRP